MGHLTETPRACFLLISISSHSWGSPVVMSEGDTRLLLPEPGQERSTLQLQPDQPCVFKNVLHQLPVIPQQHSCSLEGSQARDEELLQLIGNEATGKNQYPTQNTHKPHLTLVSPRKEGGWFPQLFVSSLPSPKWSRVLLMLLILSPPG